MTLAARTLETDRLRLEPIGEGHFEALARLRADPVIMATMRDGPETRMRTRATLDWYMATWRDQGYGIWAVLDRSSGGFLGECGFWLRDDGHGVSLRFALDLAAQGRGLAREAAAVCLGYGFAVAGLTRVVAVAQEGNAASHRILRSLGMTPLHRYQGRKASLTIYQLTRDDWCATTTG